MTFTGKERDDETVSSATMPNDYFGARYFSGTQGRFTSPDPLIMRKEWLTNPQRWDHYAYVGNSPLTYGDPDGRDTLASKNRKHFQMIGDLKLGVPNN